MTLPKKKGRIPDPSILHFLLPFSLFLRSSRLCSVFLQVSFCFLLFCCMKIYRAESGQHVHWPRSVSIHTLDEFKQELEKCTGVPASNQILMTSFGQQVKQEQLDDILRATGKDEYIIFCYDRYYLGASREEISTLLDVDVPSVQPEVKPFDAKQLIKAIAKSPSANNIPGQCQQYLDMFAQFDSHSQALLETINQHTQLARTVVEEQKAQRMALNVAFENLDTHYRLIEKNVQVFYEGADKEYARQSTLLESTDADVAILRSIRIHPAFGQSRTHLIDFLDMEQLDTSRHDASELCQNIDFAMQQLRDVINELKHHEDDLQRQIDEDHDLQTLDALLVETIDIKDRAQFLRDKIKRDLHRIYERIANVIHVPLSTLLATLSLDDLGSMGKDTSLFDPPSSSAGARDNGANGGGKKALEAIHSLADIHATDYLAKISSYELAIRQVLTKLIAIKRQSILAFLKNMNVISQLQSNIMQSQQVLNAARQQLTEFQQKYDTSYLETCRHILFAYGALLIEVVRRREFAKILKENATLMADVVGGFKEKEDDRRDYFRHDITMTLPFKIPALTNAAPQCEISTANVDESIPQITHQDIIDFVSLLDQAYARTMAKGGAPRSRGKDRLMQPNSTGPSPRTRKLITTDSYGQNLLQLLNSMNMQLDGLADEFLALIHATCKPYKKKKEKRATHADCVFFFLQFSTRCPAVCPHH
ncbi:hypothetical protein BC940DRAFT_28544 [Gongronella butleri]|nr:hypothetical protein BC940DRAFT_28544 [Gongronella butleri]